VHPGEASGTGGRDSSDSPSVSRPNYNSIDTESILEKPEGDNDHKLSKLPSNLLKSLVPPEDS
jgi:hypothetical protein